MSTASALDVVALFMELAAIESPPGREQAVARRVLRELEDFGLAPEIDDSGAVIGSDTGNISVRLPATEEGEGLPIFFCAHLDTVQPCGPIVPVIDAGVVRNDGGTILGADNKAAVAAMLDAVRLILVENRPHAGVELVFTTREETGCQGAAAFDAAWLTARAGFVYDHAAPIGDVVVAAPFQRTIDVVFRGQAAHAGMHPEEGRSAIEAAARAIADLRLGRLDDRTTANIGRIDGGSARNVVPERCSLVAEARSRDEATLVALVQEMLDAFAFAAAVTDCEVETQVSELYRGYRVDPDDLALGLAREALVRSGFEPREVEVGGGADANVFRARGIPCVVLANGMAEIHGPREHIAVADLEAMVGVTLAIVDLARDVA